MPHQGVAACIPGLHEKVKDAVEVGEVVEQPNGAGHRGAEVEDQVCRHDHIRLMAHDATCRCNVWRYYILADDDRQCSAQVSKIVGREDGRVEELALRVVK